MSASSKYVCSLKQWNGSEGVIQLKDNGYAWILSMFVSHT